MLTQCPECHKDVSDKAKLCPNCGFPVGLDKRDQLQNPGTQTESKTKEIEPTQIKPEMLNRSLSERITTNQSKDSIKALIGNVFKEIDPKFDPETLISQSSNTIESQISINSVAENIWLINVEYLEEGELSYGFFIPFGAGLLYSLFSGNMWLLIFFVLLLPAIRVLRDMTCSKWTSKGVEACLRNIKNQLDQT